MSDGKGFLTRWSSRKRAALARERRGAPHPGQAAAPPAPEPESDAAPITDVSELPPIESIGPGSDVRAFLAPGVPASLARAALRRAWSADPVIRDFIGLSENAWDFTAPGGVPGFGPLTAEDAQRLLARLQPEPGSAAGEASGPIAPERSRAATQDGTLEPPDEGIGKATAPRLADAGDAAPQPGISEPQTARGLKRHRHGGALPE